MIFEEIIVDYPPEDLCTYPEYIGKPYFSIKYEENGEHHVGFGTYKPEVLSRYLREYFIIPTIRDIAKAVVDSSIEKEEQLKKLEEELDYAKFRCTLPTLIEVDNTNYSTSEVKV